VKILRKGKFLKKKLVADFIFCGGKNHQISQKEKSPHWDLYFGGGIWFKHFFTSFWKGSIETQTVVPLPF
jgi:hypothetical protein